MLRLLLDEHIPRAVAQQLRARSPDFPIEELHEWERGMYLHAQDDVLLQAAYRQRLTLLTYDQHTIAPLVKSWAEQDVSHAGVILVSGRTIALNDIGGLVRTLVKLWDEQGHLDWANRVIYLRHP